MTVVLRVLSVAYMLTGIVAALVDRFDVGGYCLAFACYMLLCVHDKEAQPDEQKFEVER